MGRSWISVSIYTFEWKYVYTLLRWAAELEKIGAAGGNTVRVWVHVEGDVSPLYDGDGFVTGTDRAGTLISDLKSFLDECYKNNILAGLVLFNGAVLRNQKTINLFSDDDKLNSYLEQALTPMVQQLSSHPALGFWEVMNEPEGSSPAGQKDSDPCFDFTHLDWSRAEGQGPGWTDANLAIKDILHFVNWVADTIHHEDSKALVTVGSWNSLASTFIGGDDPVHKTGFNHYSAECLVKAGGKELGVMDFVEFHAFPWAGRKFQHQQNSNLFQDVGIPMRPGLQIVLKPLVLRFPYLLASFLLLPTRRARGNPCLTMPGLRTWLSIFTLRSLEEGSPGASFLMTGQVIRLWSRMSW